MKEVYCKIILDNNTICAGGILSGHVIYQFSSPETFEEIKLQLRGKAHIKYRKRRSTINYTEKFLKEEIIIYGRGRNDAEMEAGTYTYPFHYNIPSESPSSYTYHDTQRMVTSSIRYYLKAKRPTTCWTQKDAEEEFNVVKYVDLNLVPQVKDSAEVNVRKDVFWMCCTSPPFLVKFHLSKQGFIPGAQIPFTLECHNQSTHHANDVIVSLRLTIRYYRTNPDKSDERLKLDLKPTILTLSECSLGPINAREEKSWNESLDIPKVQPLHSDGCQAIEFNYIVYFKVKFPFPHRKLKGHVTLVLGNVPISDGQMSDYSTAMEPQLMFPVLRDLKEFENYMTEQSINNV